MVNHNLLSDFEIFRRLDPETFHFVGAEAILTEHQPHAALFQQGAPPTGFYALVSGRVKLYRQSTKKCQILALPMPGECFGAEALPTGSPSPYSASTLTPVTCLTITPDTLDLLLNEFPDFQEAFLKLITNRLKHFVTLVHDLAFRDVASRLALVLIARADAEGEQSERGIYFDRLLSQQELAEMVGTAREVVYRTFKKFEQAGMIEMTPAGIHIIDLDSLTQIAVRETR
jgi:CRP-like cAMP-binding protein